MEILVLDLYATPCVFEDLTTGLPLLNVRHAYPDDLPPESPP